MSRVSVPASPLVSIVICTRNRAQLLRECLKALHDQVEEMSNVQMLVIDNGSTDDTQRTIAEFANHFPHWSCVIEPDPGLSHARNRALAVAGADWLAFLDDDGRPLAGYVARLKRLASEGAFDCVGGLYLPWYRDGRKPWFRDDYASNTGTIDSFGELPAGCYASGGNCLLRKQAVLDAGGFRADLGMAGRRLGYGEETRLQVEMRKRGWRIGADPALRIEHLAAMGKQSLGVMLRAAWAVGRDRWTTFDEHPTLPVLLGVARRIVTRPLVALYRELFLEPQASHWQNLLLAAGRPPVGAAAELLAGLRQYMRIGSPLRVMKRWAQARWTARCAFSGSTAPVLVYQMGKVGSSTVYQALNGALSGVPVYHVHFLSAHLAEHRCSHERSGKGPVPFHIYLGEALREQLLRHPDRPVKIISLVRDPVAFELSNLFQNPRLVGGEAGLEQLLLEDDGLRDTLQPRLAAPGYLDGWFDREIRTVFGIDVFAEPFACERGWQRYRQGNAELLLIRLEDLSAEGPRVIADFLGLERPLALSPVNDRTSQVHGNEYRRIAASLQLDPAVLAEVYGRRFAQHFYSSAERRRMQDKWQAS